MKLESRKNFYIFSAFFIGLSLVLIFLVIYPLIKVIQESSQQLLSARGELTFFSKEKRNLRDFKDVFRKLEPDLEKIENLFVSFEVPIEFIGFLEELATDSDISIEVSSATRREVEEDPWPSYDFHLRASGSFSNFSKFIEKLENSSYLIEIYDLNVRKLEGAEFSAGDVYASLSLKVFAK